MSLKIEDIMVKRRSNYTLLILFLVFQLLIVAFPLKSTADENFESWLSSYRDFALENGVSKKTLDVAFKNVKFLSQVIKYDRKQPEFYEDTETYVSKRPSQKAFL